MSYRKFVVPVTLIALAVLGAVALTVIDTNIAINDPYPLPSGVRSDGRLWATLLGVGGIVWLAVLAVFMHFMRGHEVAARRSDDADRTEPMPRIRIVGTAAVREAPAPPVALDPKVIEIGERIARKFDN